MWQDDVARAGLIEKLVFESSPREGKGVTYVDTWRDESSREKWMQKLWGHLACLRNRKELHMAGERSLLGVEVKEVRKELHRPGMDAAFTVRGLKTVKLSCLSSSDAGVRSPFLLC